MDEKTRRAFDWAINQNHRSVAAEYAKILAIYIRDKMEIKAEVPNG